MADNAAGAALDRRYLAAEGTVHMTGVHALVRLAGATTGARIGIVAAGRTFADVRQSLRMLGLGDDELAGYGIRLLRLGMTYPLEPGIVAEFAAGPDEIVVEEKWPFAESAVKDLLFGRPDAPAVTGKKAPDGSDLLAAHGSRRPARWPPGPMW